MTTATKNQTLQELLRTPTPDLLANLLKELGIDKATSVIKAVVTGLAATATPDITSAAVKAAAVITGVSLETGENLPPIGALIALRLTASGTAPSLGVYVFGDSGATAIVPPGGAGLAVGVAKISDDGKTITFPNTVTGFTIIYIPRYNSNQALFGTTI